MPKDSFEAQPITQTILCPSCGERLLFGVTTCRFCQTTIDQSYAEASVENEALITHAVKSANIIRSLGKVAYLCLVMTVFAILFDPSYLELLLIVSFLNLIGPIKWLRKYRVYDHPEIVTATKHVRIDFYLWLVAIVVQAIALLVGVVLSKV